MPKAQADLLPLYIIGAVIFLLVLAFGYKSTSNLKGAEAKLSSYKIVEDLKKDIKLMSADYGSVKEFSYSVPGDVSEICFKDKSVNSLTTGLCPNVNEHQIANTFSKQEPDKNMLLVGDNTLKGTAYLGDLSLDCELLCFTAGNSKISLKIEGLGNKAKIRNIKNA